ncbi:apoptosis regulatory protein Siva isoform X2 [Gymnodraco acuticeps]|uniref:Apoptosis regulatory protein Siva isoform X2 n=1 Tax=Gymnodraco acuticeps TaxID=8218 RepID=A0A6P8UM84_GYMAC|nr:apoptosis regulatory protein Siva isoform X2 [Gymnodraco acuticeps]
MTKRTCPFPETFSSQYKIHVGQQELNNYSVFGNKYRQEIYSKTKNLLFNGAKAVMGKIWTGEESSTNPQPNGQAETPACSQTLLRGQTLIGQDGRLTRVNSAQGELISQADTAGRQEKRSDESLQEITYSLNLKNNRVDFPITGPEEDEEERSHC